MIFAIAAGVLLISILITGSVLVVGVMAANARHRRRADGDAKEKKPVEFSKLMLTLVLCTYFVGVGVGVKIALTDISQLGIVLAFIGTPTTAALGFYVWKAKAENIIKIKQTHPEQAGDMPVDFNNLHR